MSKTATSLPQRFKRSVDAEFRKLFATKLWWIMALVLFLYTAMMAVLFAGMFGEMSGDTSGDGTIPPGFQAAKMIYASAANFGYAVPLLFGAVMATTEIRHRILALAFVAEPKRNIVFLSKLVTIFVVGMFLGLAGVLASVGVGGTVYALLGGSTELNDFSTWALIVRTVLAIALWSVIGFGLGLTLKNQAATIVVALVFTQFLEPTLRLVSMIWEWTAKMARFFPGSATDAFVGASFLNDINAFDPDAPTGAVSLSFWQAGLVLLGIAIVIVMVGWLVRWRRDVE